MDRRGEYGGFRGNSISQEVPKGPEQQTARPVNEIANAHFEDFDDQEWAAAQQGHQVRENVMGTLESGMQNENFSVDGAEADPKYWKVMVESLKTLGPTEQHKQYIDQHLGKMEGIMAQAQEQGPARLTQEKTYIDTALGALKEYMKSLRGNERQQKASGNPTSTSWEGMQLRWKVEKDKMAAEKLRRGNQSKTEEFPVEVLDKLIDQGAQNDDFGTPTPNDTVRDLNEFRAEKAKQGFTFPDVALHKRNPKYWKNMANTIAEDPRLRGVARSIETLMKRVERGDADSILDGEIQKITEDIDRKTAA